MQSLAVSRVVHLHGGGYDGPEGEENEGEHERLRGGEEEDAVQKEVEGAGGVIPVVCLVPETWHSQ